MSTIFLSSRSGIHRCEQPEEATVSVGESTLKPVVPEPASEPEQGIAEEAVVAGAVRDNTLKPVVLEPASEPEEDAAEEVEGDPVSEPEQSIVDEVEGGQRHDAAEPEEGAAEEVEKDPFSEPEEGIMDEFEGGQRHDADSKEDDNIDEAVSEALKAMLLHAIANLCPQNMLISSSAEATSMLDTVLQYLRGRSYEVMPPREDGRQVLILNLTGTHASFRTFIDVRIPENRMSVFVVSPLKVPFHRRADVIELLMRANFSLSLGNFELDMDDGEVRMRMAVDVEGSALSVQMVETYIMVAASTMDRFFPAVMKVVYDTTVSPREAAQEIFDQLL